MRFYSFSHIQTALIATASSDWDCLFAKRCFSSVALPPVCPLWAVERFPEKFSMLTSLTVPKIIGTLNTLPVCGYHSVFHDPRNRALQWLKCINTSREVSGKSFLVATCFSSFNHEVLWFYCLHIFSILFG